MVDITPKIKSLRTAVATALVSVSKTETIAAVKAGTVPKGAVFEFARAAGLLAVKKTSDVIPDCHPLPVEYTGITYEVFEKSIRIRVEVRTIYRTGVEVEAMHGAAVAALTLYDMLKPIDPQIEISGIKLESKTGGKSGAPHVRNSDIKCAVIVCSDTVAAGTKEDGAGKRVIEKLRSFGIEVASLTVVPDSVAAIQAEAKRCCAAGFQLLLFTGGTGLSPRDVTPEALAPLIDREIPGVMDTARQYGQERMPFAMLSRGIAGFIGHTLVVTLPGSPRGAAETVDALFPHLLHVFGVAEGARHDGA